MNQVSAVGVGLLAVGLGGYGVGLLVSYPGRAFSLTAVTVGLALVAIGPSLEGGEVADTASEGSGA